MANVYWCFRTHTSHYRRQPPHHDTQALPSAHHNGNTHRLKALDHDIWSYVVTSLRPVHAP